jgi:gamma-glutamyltranspeptidase/glutathione hydrolase
MPAEWSLDMLRRIAISALVAGFAASNGSSLSSQGSPPRSGMVSSAHPLATEAGLEILRAGGNAFDAAVAVAATLNVVEPAMSGAGGYGTIVLHHAASKETWYLNPSGRIPAGVDSDAFRAPTPGYRENRRGAKSVSTPGNVNAWEAMSKKYGQLQWRRLFEPAIRLAADGYELDQRGAGMIADSFEGFPAQAREIYGSGGKPLGRGERLRQSDLAKSLTLIADHGARVFYSGEIAKAIASAMQEAGGFLALADLAADRAEWWKPIAIRYRDVDVVTASPPANAFDYLVRLGIMGRFDNRALGHNSVEYLHRFAEATKHGFWVRLRHAGDPDIAPPPLERLLSPPYWREQASSIDPEKAKPFVPPGPRPSGSGGDRAHTTHFVVADRFGNVVSATQTLGGAFGARIMPRGTGIWLNDSLEFSTFEPKGNPMDAHAGRRKLSGDCPTILMRNGRPWVALGTPGGHTIGQTVPQMVMNLVDFRMDVGAALAAPRISFGEPDLIAVEGSISEDVRRGLEAKGHKLRVVRALGNAHALAIEYDARGRVRRFSGAADPRGAGLAKGF